jgi:hypothetical protein
MLFLVVVVLAFCGPLINAQTTCGAQGTRCCGGASGVSCPGPLSFAYSCCQGGMGCQPVDSNGGACEFNGSPVPPVVTPYPTVDEKVSTCGVQGVRCCGGISNISCPGPLPGLYTCCQPGQGCVPSDSNGGTCEYTNAPTQVPLGTPTLMPTAQPTKAPTEQPTPAPPTFIGPTSPSSSLSCNLAGFVVMVFMFCLVFA